MTEKERALLMGLAEALCADIPIRGMKDVVEISRYAARIKPLLAQAQRERDNPPESR